MGNRNGSRVQFKARELITSSLAAAKQDLTFTNYFLQGDIVKVVALNSSGCQVGAELASGLTIDAIESGSSLIFDASIDTSTALPAGGVGWFVVADEIGLNQDAVDRLYHISDPNNPGSAQICSAIVQDSNLNVDVDDAAAPGNSVQFVDDVNLFRVGDPIQMTSDNGEIGVGTIVAIDIRADTIGNYSRIEINSVLDTAGEPNAQICSTNLTQSILNNRFRENIDAIDAPVEEEDLDDGNCIDTVFETDNLYLVGTAKPYIDDGRKKKGTAGTRSSLEIGTFPGVNTSLRGDSMILGLLGNNVELAVIAGAGSAITVTKNFKVVGNGDMSQSAYLITIEDNGGAATSKELADALNIHAEVRRIAQFRYGGDGAGVVAPFVSTAFAGGLNDGTKDYAELEQVYLNEILFTGYKWISYHIRPSNDEPNRMNEPPQDDEDLFIDYRRALTNA